MSLSEEFAPKSQSIQKEGPKSAGSVRGWPMRRDPAARDPEGELPFYIGEGCLRRYRHRYAPNDRSKEFQIFSPSNPA